MPRQRQSRTKETGRTIGEAMNNPMSEVPMRERDIMKEALKDGSHGIGAFMPRKGKK